MNPEDVFLYSISLLAVCLVFALPLLVLRGRRVMADNARIVGTNEKIEANQRELIAGDARRIAALEAIAASLARIEAKLDARRGE